MDLKTFLSSADFKNKLRTSTFESTWITKFYIIYSFVTTEQTLSADEDYVNGL